MDLFNDLIKDTCKKIDRGNTNFCGTPVANAKKLSKSVAKSILLGQGNVDDLLANAGKDVEDDYKNKRVCT